MHSLRVIVLGTGTSHGIPMIGCDCAVCTSPDPRDRRTRSSIIIEINGHNVLVDTTPELRLQCVAAGVRTVEAVLFTHHHADHVTGLDDLRRFNWINSAPLPCHGEEATLRALAQMFPYAFIDMPDYPSTKPSLIPERITGPLELFGETVTPLRLFHGQMPVLGFRVGPFAYCTDCNQIPPESMDALRGVEVLILDALRRRPHPTHFNLEQAVEAAGRIGAEQTWFTHIAHELGHAATNAELPSGMALAYDGQVIELL